VTLPVVEIEPHWKTKVSRKYMHAGELEILLSLLYHIQPKSMVEFGVNVGITANAVLHNFPDMEHYLGIDVEPNHAMEIAWQQNEIPMEPGSLVVNDPRFELVIRPSRRELRHRFDAAFIDGDHGFNAVISDYLTAVEIVNPGGIIIFHDYTNPTVMVTEALGQPSPARGRHQARGRDLAGIRTHIMVIEVILSDAYCAARHISFGMDYQNQNLFQEAIFEYDNALKYAPHYENYAHWNKALALLSLGEYEQGFKEHDWVWKLFNWRGFGPVQQDIDKITHLPLWEGEDIHDKNLLIYHELGFGDAIQTMRYLPELKRRASKIVLVVDKSLIRLAEQFEIDVVDHIPNDLSSFDYRLPFFGVMMALRQTLSTIPNDPYLHATSWFPPRGLIKTRLTRATKDVGIVWSGRSQKMFSLERFLLMLDHDDFDLYSLQPGRIDNDEVRELAICDFQDTADMILWMDHIVTIDSAVAHLAGALGHPSIHLLLPYRMDWRWWHSSTWYPTISTYRQDNDFEDWAKPFEQLTRRWPHDRHCHKTSGEGQGRAGQCARGQVHRGRVPTRPLLAAHLWRLVVGGSRQQFELVADGLRRGARVRVRHGRGMRQRLQPNRCHLSWRSLEFTGQWRPHESHDLGLVSHLENP
jgi:predicted O-methyltransferase YrrM